MARRGDDSADRVGTGRAVLTWRWLPLPLLALTILGTRLGPLHGAPPRESLALALALGFCFVAVPSTVVTVLFARSFLILRAPGLLAVAIGSFLWGVSNPLSILLSSGDVNSMITVHNVLALAAGLGHLTGALLPESGQPGWMARRPQTALAGAYLAATVGVVALALAVEARLTPTFFVQGEGGTPLRQLVLGAAMIAFALASLLLWRRMHRGASMAFLAWYVPGLATIALGLFGVLLQSSAGGYVSWMGRLSQYVGGAWLVVASLSLLGESGQWTLSLEAQARESEARYRTLVELSPDAVFVNLGNSITFINPAGLRLFGATSLTQVLGRSPLDFIDPEYHPLVRSRIQQLMAGGSVTPRAIRFRRLDGSTVEAEATGTPFETAGGRALQVIARDITERRRAEAALAAGERRFRALADNMAQLAWMADRDGARTWFNRRWVEYTGLDEGTSAGDGWLAAHHPDQRRAMAERYHDRIAAGDPWEDSVRLRSADGHYRWFLVRAVPIHDAAGVVLQWFGTDTDITVQHEAEEALVRAVSLRDEFLSIASHELRTPLTALDLHLEGAARLLPGPDGRPGEGRDAGRAAARLASAMRQTRRLGRLIEDLLSVSRIIDDRLVLRREPCDLSRLVEEGVEEARAVAAQSGSEVRTFVEPGISVHADGARLDQVLSNLLGNAIKYGAGAPIDVELARAEAGVRLRVRDRGIGIAAGDQERIFARFERAVSPRHYGGLGLGLYIARQIVEAHGGRIEVESRPESGATFTVLLPASVAASSEPARAASTSAGAAP